MSGYTAVNLKAVIIAHTVARVRTAVACFVTCTVALCFNEQQNKKNLCDPPSHPPAPLLYNLPIYCIFLYKIASL